MFGLVMADAKELTKAQQARYGSVYCGICRRIRLQSSGASRMGLSYDMAFLALLHMSLYEPEETLGRGACHLHPIKPRDYTDNPFIAYCADMNVALAYYKAMDDREDDQALKARLCAHVFGGALPDIRARYPRQCEAIETCISDLRALEKAGCANPDEPAGCFGALMAELLVYQEDHWSDTLRQMGMALGRFIYLADAAIDYRADRKKGSYNPFLAMETGEDPARWEEYLVLAMGRCTQYYERLPLIQDKAILDNILYSGVWLSYRRQMRGESKHDR